MENIIYMCTNRGRNEYVLVNGKRYNCLEKAKERARRYGLNDRGRGYAEGMEHLAWQVFVKGSLENEELFEEENVFKAT